MFMISAAEVSTKSIKNGTVYPPEISSTLLDTVAIREPPMTVNVMNAMLVEKYFKPKKADVNAAVIVGQDP